MTMQYSGAARDAMNDMLETTIGVSPKLRLYTGSKPANCAASATGTMVVEMLLPSDFLGASSGGVKSKSGTWAGTAVAAGTAGYFRIVDNAGTTCHAQGTVDQTVAAGGAGTGDLNLDNPVIALSQVVTISAATFTEAGA